MKTDKQSKNDAKQMPERNWLVAKEAFLIDLKAGDAVKPFHLKYLAELKPVQ
jgi:hypothetical protein